MKKIFVSIAVALAGLSVRAAFPYSTNDAFNIPLYGNSGKSNVFAVSKAGAVQADSSLTVGGALSASGALTASNVTVNGASIKTAGSLSITNKQAISLPSRSVVSVASPGAFPTSTNTISAPSTALVGAMVYVFNSGTNDLLILESGVLSSAGNLTLGTKDGVWFYVNATNDVIQATPVINN